MEYWQTVLIYWLVIHFLLEYTIFPARDEKLYGNKKLLWLQMGIYGVAMLSCMLFVIGSCWKALLAWGLLLIVRGILVCLRCFFEGKNLKPKMAFWLVGMQQVLMVGLLLFACYMFLNSWGAFRYRRWLVDGQSVALLSLMFVLIWDVASSFIRRLFSLVPISSEVAAHDKYAMFESARSGELIGKLERLVVVLLILFNQFAAIGFVLTAKSLARFKMFEDRDFAERYLIGTLSSFIYAIVVGFIGKCLLQKMNALSSILQSLFSL